jgi:hypothetical protein
MGGPAHDIALDQRDGRPEPGGVAGGLVAGGTSSDDDEAHGHSSTL